MVPQAVEHGASHRGSRAPAWHNAHHPLLTVASRDDPRREEEQHGMQMAPQWLGLFVRPLDPGREALPNRSHLPPFGNVQRSFRICAHGAQRAGHQLAVLLSLVCLCTTDRAIDLDGNSLFGFLHWLAPRYMHYMSAYTSYNLSVTYPVIPPLLPFTTRRAVASPSFLPLWSLVSSRYHV